MKKIGNGNMALPLIEPTVLKFGPFTMRLFGKTIKIRERRYERGGVFFRIWGGPIVDRPDGFVAVKMAKEIPWRAAKGQSLGDVDIPTADFRVPPLRELDIGLERAVEHLLEGEHVYVGCMGGKGRTGLFLAVLAKAFGIEKPVEYVRQHYYPHAVETAEQYKFVTDYVVPPTVLSRLHDAKARSRSAFRNIEVTPAV